MEPILDYVKRAEQNKKDVDLGSELAFKSGFNKAGKKSKVKELGYIAIKEVRIVEYLKALVTKDAGDQKISYFQGGTIGDDVYAYAHLIERIFHRDRYCTDTFRWDETLVEKYGGVPPKYVYEKLLMARNDNIFDYFTVAEIKKVKDPLLLGRIEGDNNRYFIAQWDDDIQLDNLI